MSGVRRIGLRTRLALAMAGVCVIGVTISYVLGAAGVDRRLTAFAREHAEAATAETTEHAAEYFRQAGGWSRQDVIELRELAGAAGFRLAMLYPDGRPIPGSGPPPAGAPTVPVLSGGRTVGRVVVTPASNEPFRAEDRDLQQELKYVYGVSAVLAVLLAALVAVAVATRLSRPIRRLTAVAQRMERGDLATRPAPGGGLEIEQLGATLNRLAGSLERGERRRRAAAADIAHELRTPVSGILSRIEAAQDGVLPESERTLEAMHTEALRLSRLVDDVERLAEAEQAGPLVARRPLDLATVARGQAELHADYFKAKGIDFRVTGAATPLAGDERRLEQVVANLLANALRYTDPGGRVMLSVRAEGSRALLEVRDSGMGIEDADLPHVFERFWRGDRSRSRATGGSGVGLAVVHELVRAHGGEVRVSSAPGRGSTFRVVLPREVETYSASASARGRTGVRALREPAGSA